MSGELFDLVVLLRHAYVPSPTGRGRQWFQASARVAIQLRERSAYIARVAVQTPRHLGLDAGIDDRFIDV
jgi:hypothetical protein